ncbi:transient receptor potential cation channel subfamily M member-like 2 isoform X3 [Symsagittifera roscoffensis]|uniref:transient receptor potential cation channel subfamily M member-like 2 isoform X3 n=1 Tax=Symsagittifera roscoffensis TaxID=84072 RepID=UPI00307C8E1D
MDSHSRTQIMSGLEVLNFTICKMRKRDFDQYRVERLLFLIQREQEKLNFFYERKYCRLECGRFFPPIRCSVIENPVSGESVERAGEDEASQSVRYSRVFGTFNHDDFRAVDESELCSGCGYAYVDHYKVSQPPRWTIEDSKWRREHHLLHIKYSERSFGVTVSDEVLGLEKSAQIAVLSSDTHPAIVMDILCNKWKLSIPDIVISVVGTSDRFPLTASQLTHFKGGFCRALSSCRAWVVGGGTLHGVDAVITECVKEMQILEWIHSKSPKLYLIAFTNWDCIDSKTKANEWFFTQQNSDPFPYYIRRRKAAFDETTQNLTASLNPFFPHILAIQGGVRGQLAQELEVRSTTEEFLSKAFESEDPNKDSNKNNKNNKSNPGMGIPTVQILIGGHLSDLARVAKSVACQTPVVICQGSGGISDIILSALKMSGVTADASQSTTTLRPYQENKLVHQLKAFMNDCRISKSRKSEERDSPEGRLFSSQLMDLTPQIVHLRTCVRNRKFFTMYRLDMPGLGTPLDQCILRALLTGATTQKVDPVALALKWNRCDEVVQEILLSEGQDINMRANIEDFVTHALLESKLEFLQLFTDLGFEFSNYLNRAKMEFIFEHLIENREYAKRIFTSRVKKNIALREKRMNFISSDGSFPIRLEDVYFVCSRFCGVKPIAQTILNTSGEEIFPDPARELFLWSIFSCDLEMAEMFWKTCKTPLALALVASMLARQCASFLPSEENSLEEKFGKIEKAFLQNSMAFIEKATRDEAWTSNDLMALKLITRPIRSLSDIRIVDIAYYIGCKEFLAHPCVQVYVEKSWKSGVKMKFFHVFKAFFLIPIRLFLPWNFQEYFDSLKPNQNSDVKFEEVDTEFFLRKFRDSRHSMFNNGNLIYDKRKLEAQITDSQTFPAESQLAPANSSAKSIFYSIHNFYTSSISKFLISLIAYVTYLLVISSLVLYDSKTPNVFAKDYTLFILNIALLMQSIQLFFQPRVFFGYRVQLWCYCEWNLVGCSSIFLGFLGFALKMADHLTSYSLINEAHCFYCLSCCLAWVRLISFYILNSTVGPLWIMLRKMLVEAVCFLSVLGVITLAAGITLQVCMNSFDYSDPYSGSLQWLILRPYFMYNGQKFVSTVLSTAMVPPPGVNVTEEFLAEKKNFISIYMWLLLMFLWVGTALMLNLLIALFNEIFKFINQRSHFEWKAENFCLQREFSDRPVLPAPFSIFESVYKLFFSRRRNEQPQTSQELESQDEKLSTMFQRKWATEVLAEKQKKVPLKESVKQTIKSADKQRSRIEDFDIIMKEMFRLYQDKSRREKEKLLESDAKSEETLEDLEI